MVETKAETSGTLNPGKASVEDGRKPMTHPLRKGRIRGLNGLVLETGPEVVSKSPLDIADPTGRSLNLVDLKSLDGMDAVEAMVVEPKD